MTAKAKRDGTTGPTGKGRGLTIHTTTALKDLRGPYDLDGPTLARLLGVSGTTLAEWEEGTAAPDAVGLEKIKRAEGILKGLARAIKKGFIAAWLTHPNDACDGRAPIDVLAAGDYETVEDVVYFLEAGEPV